MITVPTTMACTKHAEARLQGLTAYCCWTAPSRKYHKCCLVNNKSTFGPCTEITRQMLPLQCPAKHCTSAEQIQNLDAQHGWQVCKHVAQNSQGQCRGLAVAQDAEPSLRARSSSALLAMMMIGYTVYQPISAVYRRKPLAAYPFFPRNRDVKCLEAGWTKGHAVLVPLVQGLRALRGSLSYFITKSARHTVTSPHAARSHSHLLGMQMQLILSFLSMLQACISSSVPVKGF